MSQFFRVHPTHPQARLLRHAADILAGGGVVVFPTDSTYALGCHLGDKNAVERVRRIRRLGEKHDMTLMCRDLSEIAVYAHVDNAEYRLMRRLLPGPYTLLLRGTREVPRRLLHPKRKTIGLRVPQHAIARDLLAAHGAPIMSTTLRLPDDELPLTDPDDMLARLGHLVDLVIDGGPGALEPTTVLDLTSGMPELVRPGSGVWPLARER